MGHRGRNDRELGASSYASRPIEGLDLLKLAFVTCYSQSVLLWRFIALANSLGCKGMTGSASFGKIWNLSTIRHNDRTEAGHWTPTDYLVSWSRSYVLVVLMEQAVCVLIVWPGEGNILEKGVGKPPH